MRKTCLNKVYDLAKKNENVVFIGSDLSPGLLQEMKNEFPLRYFMEGVSEQHIIGMAAGMALNGFMPFVNTISTFITRRCFEQIAIDVCLHNLPVRLIGNGGGVVYAPLGPTHLAFDDIALMRSLPNMSIVACSDKDEMSQLMDASIDWPQPLYIRLGKGGDPIISSPANKFSIGKAILIKECISPDVLLISTGIMTAKVLKAVEMAERSGVACEVAHVHTIKPLDTETLFDRISKVRTVITVEEHSAIGGLGSAIVDALVERNHVIPQKLVKLALPDIFVENYGSQDEILKKFGLCPDGIFETIMSQQD